MISLPLRCKLGGKSEPGFFPLVYVWLAIIAFPLEEYDEDSCCGYLGGLRFVLSNSRSALGLWKA